MRGRIREWILVAAGLIIFAVAAYSMAANRRADIWKQRADSTRVASAAEIARLQREVVELQLVADSLTVAYLSWMDSITSLPPDVPRIQTRYVTVLDTAQMTEAVREAVTALRIENGQLREQNDTLRARLATIEEQTARVIAELRGNYDDQVRSLQIAVTEAQNTIAVQAEALEKGRQGTSIWTKLAWAGVGYGIAMGVDYLRGDDGGAVVVVQDTPSGCSGCR